MQGARTYTVEFIGFSTAEKAPFVSILKLSQCRPICYEEKKDAGADLCLVNSANQAAMGELLARGRALAKVVLIGDTEPGDSRWKRMGRPIRWGRLFEMLDEFSVEAPGLPSNVTPIGIAAPQAPAPARAAPVGRVLVVDDNHTVRTFMAEKLKPFQFDVEFAASGEEALMLARSVRYTCVFLDVVMGGIDGYQVCRQLKSDTTTRDSAVVMLTSRDSPIDRIRGKMAGCNGYLTKPVDEEKLLATFSRFLGHGQLASLP
jgi:twitching motility two-component system response regulator PilG